MGRTIAGAEADMVEWLGWMRRYVRCDLVREGDGGLLTVPLLTLTRSVADPYPYPNPIRIFLWHFYLYRIHTPQESARIVDR